jgi:lactate dehydrogenase-like 2-hydroxyacid dehydrogenase
MTISMLRLVLVEVRPSSQFHPNISSPSPGIAVSNTPSMNIYAVADLTIFLMIGALRQISAPIKAFRSGIIILFTSAEPLLTCLLKARKTGEGKTLLSVMILGISY